MNFNDFRDLIKNNSKKGIKTEFMKVALSIDDYRKAKPSDYGIEDSFLAEYDRNKGYYIFYYPDKEEELCLKNDDVEDKFYERGWGTYLHK